MYVGRRPPRPRRDVDSGCDPRDGTASQRLWAGLHVKRWSTTSRRRRDLDWWELATRRPRHRRPAARHRTLRVGKPTGGGIARRRQHGSRGEHLDHQHQRHGDPARRGFGVGAGGVGGVLEARGRARLRPRPLQCRRRRRQPAHDALRQRRPEEHGLQSHLHAGARRDPAGRRGQPRRRGRVPDVGGLRGVRAGHQRDQREREQHEPDQRLNIRLLPGAANSAGGQRGPSRTCRGTLVTLSVLSPPRPRRRSSPLASPGRSLRADGHPAAQHGHPTSPYRPGSRLPPHVDEAPTSTSTTSAHWTAAARGSCLVLRQSPAGRRGSSRWASRATRARCSARRNARVRRRTSQHFNALRGRQLRHVPLESPTPPVRGHPGLHIFAPARPCADRHRVCLDDTVRRRPADLFFAPNALSPIWTSSPRSPHIAGSQASARPPPSAGGLQAVRASSATEHRRCWGRAPQRPRRPRFRGSPLRVTSSRRLRDDKGWTPNPRGTEPDHCLW